MDLDDKVLHYVLIGIGLAVGTTIKKGFELLADAFWNTERNAFKKWKEEHPFLSKRNKEHPDS